MSKQECMRLDVPSDVTLHKSSRSMRTFSAPNSQFCLRYPEETTEEVKTPMPAFFSDRAQKAES